jgi:hypothetical protein
VPFKKGLMKNHKTIFLCFLILGICVGCKKDTAIDASPTNPTNPVPVIDDFPNKSGYKWTYVVYDSVATPKIDTVKITVGGQTTLQGGKQVTIWQLIYSGGTVFVDTNFIYKNLDTAEIHYTKPASNYMALKDKFIFPFVINKKWSPEFIPKDTCKIISNNPFTVTAGTFTNCFYLERLSFGAIPNYSLFEKIWFVPKVGVIKQVIKENYFGPLKNETWVLVNYQFN